MKAGFFDCQQEPCLASKEAAAYSHMRKRVVLNKLELSRGYGGR